MKLLETIRSRCVLILNLSSWKEPEPVCRRSVGWVWYGWKRLTYTGRSVSRYAVHAPLDGNVRTVNQNKSRSYKSSKSVGLAIFLTSTIPFIENHPKHVCHFRNWYRWHNFCSSWPSPASLHALCHSKADWGYCFFRDHRKRRFLRDWSSRLVLPR